MNNQQAAEAARADASKWVRYKPLIIGGVGLAFIIVVIIIVVLSDPDILHPWKLTTKGMWFGGNIIHHALNPDDGTKFTEYGIRSYLKKHPDIKQYALAADGGLYTSVDTAVTQGPTEGAIKFYVRGS